MEFDTSLSPDFDSFLKNIVNIVDLLEKSESTKAINPAISPLTIYKFLKSNSSYLDYQNINVEQIKILEEKLKNLDKEILKIKKAPETCKVIHNKIEDIVSSLFPTSAAEISLMILSELPASTDAEIEKSYQTIRDIERTDAGLSREALANWINSNKIPIHKLNLSLEKLKEIGPWLKYLDLTHCQIPVQDLETLDFDQYFPNLTHLKLTKSKITKFLTLPSHLQILDCSLCSRITEILKLPESLKILDCRQCMQLNRLPTLPKGLEELNCRWCEWLTQLPALPNSIKTLNLSFCDSLESLPTLPGNLKILNITHCINLKNLPLLPVNLEELICRDCIILEVPLAFPRNLKILDYRGTPFQTIPPTPMECVVQG